MIDDCRLKNFYQIIIVENIVVFLSLKVLRSRLKIISFQNHKYSYLIQAWSNQAYKGTVVNQDGHLKLNLQFG